MVSRIIMPIINQPNLNSTTGESTGVGDINPTFFFSPASQSKLIWGFGPAFLLPTGTQRAVGTGKWSVGPAAVVLAQPGHWTIGAIGSQIWSFAGPDDRSAVSAMSIQYFANYNLSHGWYLSSSPIVTANWKAPSSEEWVVPFGGGGGRIFKIGKLPFNGGIEAFYNVRPDDSQTIGRWSTRVYLAPLFPTEKPRPKPEESATANAAPAKPAAVAAQNQPGR